MQTAEIYGPFPPFDDSLNVLADSVTKMDVPRRELNILKSPGRASYINRN